MKTHSTLPLLILSLACACGKGPAQPRLSKVAYSDGTEIGFTYTDGRITFVKVSHGSGTTDEFSVSYADDRVTSVAHKGVELQTNSSLSYEGGRLKTVTITDASGKTLESLTHSYTDGKLSKSEHSWGSNDPSDVLTTTFSYVGNRLDRQVANVLGFVSQDQTTQHMYEGDLLVRSQSNGPYATTVRYSYDERQRLQKVVGVRTTTYEYAGDLVSKVVTDDGRTPLTATYSYEPGEAEGVIPLVIEFCLTLLLPAGHPRFDLAGRMIPADESLLTSDVVLLGMD